MELSPSRLANVEFRTEMRGYARDDVDRFLEDVAAGVAALQEKLDVLTRRVARAEEDAGEARDLEDTMRRTLLLAQRTADAAVKEAEARASKTLAEAADRADKVNSLADEKARSIVEEARMRAEGEYRDQRQQLAAEVEQLEATRDALTAQIGRLADHLEDERESVRSTLQQLLRFVEDQRFLAVDRTGQPGETVGDDSGGEPVEGDQPPEEHHAGQADDSAAGKELTPELTPDDTAADAAHDDTDSEFEAAGSGSAAGPS